MDDELPKELGRTLRYILKIEKTTTGRVNTIAVVLTGIAAIYKGELFTQYGFMLLVLFIASAIIADLALRYKRKKRRG